MTHISHLNIQHFKNIDELEINPGRINIITGRNNSGKTSLLQSVFITSLPSSELIDSSKIMEIADFVQKGETCSVIASNMSDKTIYDSLKGLNPADRIRILTLINKYLETHFLDYVSDLSDSKITYVESSKLKPHIENIIEIYIEDTNFIIIKEDNEISIAPLERMRHFQKSRLRKKIIDSENIEISRSELDLIFELFQESFSDSLLKNNPSDTSKGKTEVLYLSESDKIKNPFAFQKIAETRELEDFIKEYNLIDNFSRLDTSGILYREKNGREYELPFKSHGEGFLALINIINKLKGVSGGIFLIEELENHLHPGYLDLLIDTIFSLSEELSIQVFITTHSLDLIESTLDTAVNLNQEENLKIFNLRKDGDKTGIREFDFKEASRYLNELGLDLRGI